MAIQASKTLTFKNRLKMQNTIKTEDYLTCYKCGGSNDFATELKSNNLVAICRGCGSFIKNVPYKEPAFYFGKYKGTAIKDIIDKDYLTWALNTVRLSSSLRAAISERINTLEFLAK